MTKAQILKRIKDKKYDDSLYDALLNYDGNVWHVIRDVYPEKSPEYQELANKYREYLKRPRNEDPAPAKEKLPQQAQEARLVNDFTPDEVQLALLYDANEKVVQAVENHKRVLMYDSRFSGKIRFNEFTHQDYLVGDVPWLRHGESNMRPWTNTDDSYAFSIIQSEYGLRNRKDYFDAIKIISNRNSFHPVRDYLEGLTWDGQEHIKHLLPDYLGAEPTEYNTEVFRLWMLGAVARVFHPGCKFDYTIILQGRQGIGKSTFLQNLAINDDWFNDSLDKLDGDKAIELIIGTWICELSELKSLARTAGGVESVKRFLTARQDRCRLSYERRSETFLRQTVFAGTSNKSDFLEDQTGNRRFLIIEVGRQPIRKSLFDKSCIDDIKQAWAEAVRIYKTDKPELVLPMEVVQEAEQLQSDYRTDDGTEGLIIDYLKDKRRVCVLQIWRDALKEEGRPPKWMSSKITDIILQSGEWERIKNPAKFDGYGTQRGFQLKEIPVESLLSIVNKLDFVDQKSEIVDADPDEIFT